MESPPTLRFGPYEVVAPIGSGGMGEVYRARDPRLGRDVAIKVLSAGTQADVEHLRRLEQEARAAGGLNHPNILAIYDIGSHDGRPYVVSELLEGETLRERIMREGALGARRAIELAVQIAQGLAAAHEKGIVHRDLKPENLFVTRDGRIKILDFGLAKLASMDMPAHSDTTGPILSPGTEPGKILGTVGYMSPEQVRGQSLDHRSDIFSFGAILYEMLSGRRAFSGGSAADTLSAILKEEPPELLLPTHVLPPMFEQVVRHCLEKDRELRFASARDLTFNLQALAGASTRSAAGPTLRQRRVPRKLAWGVVGLSLLALAGWQGARLGRQSEPRFHQLTFKRGAVLAARFVADGQTILYGAAWDGGATRLYSTRPGGTESSALPLPPASVLSVSPSGELLLSLSHRFRVGFQFSGTLARAPLSGGAPRELLEGVTEAC
jgi:serine/threonine protein kinase